MINKKLNRQKRAKRTRFKIKKLHAVRLCVNRTLKHVYAQIIIYTPTSSYVVASASTLDADIRNSGARGRNIHSAAIVGSVVAKRAIEKGVMKVAFDRSGFKYHGIVKALADAARNNGLIF